ncbi:MAG: hypothetical protein H0U49_07870 [Parachlamydiaceae bacterium]|nr:hypothetical protein [Parachlamydiaceae bacterium]
MIRSTNYLADYQKILTEDLFNSDIKDSITEFCSIPELKTLQAVSKAWSSAASAKAQWQSIGNSLQLPINKFNQANIKKYIGETKDKVKSCRVLPFFCRPFSFGSFRRNATFFRNS